MEIDSGFSVPRQQKTAHSLIKKKVGNTQDFFLHKVMCGCNCAQAND